MDSSQYNTDKAAASFVIAVFYSIAQSVAFEKRKSSCNGFMNPLANVWWGVI